MANHITRVKDDPLTVRVNLDRLMGGWSTRSYPHEIEDSQLAVLDNFVHSRDNIWSLRPGNVLYGGGAGTTGSGLKALNLARFYSGNMTSGTLCVHSGTNFYTGNDTTGAFTSQNTSLSSTTRMMTTQMFDPDNPSGAATSLFICDGSRVPQLWDGTNWNAVKTGGSFLPNGTASGAPIKPLYCASWNYHLVYANESTDPTALWISDALRPERFTGTTFTDSGGTNYTPYYPGGRDAGLGVITGVAALGPLLGIFFTNGIITAWNTGSFGAFQFVFNTLSRTIGCPSPMSIAVMDSQIIFFGGDRFYATDLQTVYPLPDLIPTVYDYDNISLNPPLINNISTVVGVRRSLTYWASYDTGNGYQSQIVVFDTQGNGGWQYSSSTGGVWSRFPTGFNLACGIECRGPGDTTRPFFWGNSNADQIAQHDPTTATYTDFGAAINYELRTKSFFFDEPIKPKLCLGIYPLMVFTPTSNGTYNVNAVQPYVYTDSGPESFSNISYTVTPQGTLFGSGALFGTGVLFEDGTLPDQQSKKSFPPGGAAFPKGNSVAFGVTGSSNQPFNLIGFSADVLIDEPEL